MGEFIDHSWYAATAFLEKLEAEVWVYVCCVQDVRTSVQRLVGTIRRPFSTQEEREGWLSRLFLRRCQSCKESGQNNVKLKIHVRVSFVITVLIKWNSSENTAMR